jgi:hypothetical protein
MTDQHPLEQLLRDAKQREDALAAAAMAQLRAADHLQEQVRSEWLRTKGELNSEIALANAVLENHDLSERYTLRDVPDAGTGNVARCNLGLAYPSKPARAEYDVVVEAGDGRINLHHRATGQRHQQLTVITATAADWRTTLVGLYEDHLKKGREPKSAAQAETVVVPAAAVGRRSR